MKRSNNRIKKVLIANRGEIALRIQRACHKRRITTATIVSEADRNSLAAELADEVIVIGSASARESYLAADKIVYAALNSGCDAIHPGYGFLSENGDFASLVEREGLIFIGPRSETIRKMGSKTEAKLIAKAVGVPCAPGTVGGLSNDELITQSTAVGFPLIIKAVAGGGGRGMRVVNSQDELRSILPDARNEVQKHFGSPDVFLEKLIVKPRHVEAQIFGDMFGNVVHFGTRDCSTQRRHQKLIEEAPAPNLPEKVREGIQSAAVRLAKSVNYVGAGTLEFLVEGSEFYFLEMNTRIQVEHPVTEEITGVDLVALQLLVAEGQRLPYRQGNIRFKGHSIEFRINGENIFNSFAPAYGLIEKMELPTEKGVRLDLGYEQGKRVPGHYDSLLGKIIVTAETREAALEKSLMFISRCVILGIPTSLDLAAGLLENGIFKSGPVDIGFVEREVQPLLKKGCGLRQAELLQFFRKKLSDRALWDPQHRYLMKSLREKALGTDAPLNREVGFSSGGFPSSGYQSALCEGSQTEEEDKHLPLGGAYEVEDKHFYDYQSKKFKTKYTIEVLHRRDGFFLATPVDGNGRRARNKNCRMSNGLNTVVRSIIADVLEKTPPAELFA